MKHSFDDIRGEHIRALFSTPRLVYSTSLVIFCYAALGLAYPLYNGFLATYLAEKNASFGNTSLDATYAGYTYQAACGVPGSLVAAVMVESARGGRKFAMAFFTISAGVFLFGLTRARNGTTIDVLTCFASFFENAFCKRLVTFPIRSIGLMRGRWRAVRLRTRSLPNPVTRDRRCSRCCGIPGCWYLRTGHRCLLQSREDARWACLCFRFYFRCVRSTVFFISHG